MLTGSQLPQYGCFAPGRTSNGLFCLPRNRTISNLILDQVLQISTSPLYRNFYQDAGNREQYQDKLRGFIPRAARFHTGIKLWSNQPVKNSLYHKLYNPNSVRRQIQSDGGRFLETMQYANSKRLSSDARPPRSSTPCIPVSSSATDGLRDSLFWRRFSTRDEFATGADYLTASAMPGAKPKPQQLGGKRICPSLAARTTIGSTRSSTRSLRPSGPF